MAGQALDVFEGYACSNRSVMVVTRKEWGERRSEQDGKGWSSRLTDRGRTRQRAGGRGMLLVSPALTAVPIEEATGARRLCPGRPPAGASENAKNRFRREKSTN